MTHPHTTTRIVIAITAAVLLVHILGCGGCFIQDPPEPLIDEDGRIVTYHGVNVANVSKMMDDHTPWHTRDDFARLNDWGFNLVRYLVFWEAIEPTPGVYDEAYLDRVVERVRWLHELDIDVVVDVHQDLYARRFTGNGFPEWTIYDGGHTFTPRQPWNLNYLEPAVRAAYHNFWSRDELRDRYVAMLRHLLRRVDAEPNVIGLDIMNEPWPSYDADFEARILSGFYTEVQAMHAAESFRTRLFFEPVIFTSAGLPTFLRFDPGDRAVIFPHFYDPFCHEGLAYGPANRVLMGVAVAGKVAEARAMGTPLLFGEFGVSPAVPGAGQYLGDFVGLMERYQLGWTYYSYDHVRHSANGLLDDAGPRREILSHLVQVYAMRIAGRNPTITRTATSFELRYEPVELAAPTVVFIPPELPSVHAMINGEAVLVAADERYLTHVAIDVGVQQCIRIEWGESPAGK